MKKLLLFSFIFTCILNNYVSKKVMIQAHRGMSNEIEENTIESFKKAIEYGIDGFETDAFLTKDNIIVLVHFGNKLEKQYNIKGHIKDYTYEETRKFKTINGNYSMPKLEDVMKEIKGKIFMNLELKDNNIEIMWKELTKLIEKYDFFDNLSISSFHHEYYDKINEYNKKNDRNIVFGFLYYSSIFSGRFINNLFTKYSKVKSFPIDNYDYKFKGHQINLYYLDVTEEVCKKAHENGMKVAAWFSFKNDNLLLKTLSKLTLLNTFITPESEENISLITRQLIMNGVDVIISGYPRNVREVRDQMEIEKKSNINTNDNKNKDL